MQENINDKKIDKILKNEKANFPTSTISFNPKKLTAANVGIESKKEIFAESYLLKFNNLEEVIVIPDLLTPGTSERIWNKPINKID